MAPTASAGFLPDGAFSSKAAGTVGAAFLQNVFGARAAAMGGAVAASAQGAESLFLNPAALARFERSSPSEVALGYDALLETAYQGAAAYARPLGDGALGAGLIYASQGAQTSYNAVGDATGKFTPLDFAAGAGYGLRLGRAALGAGLKLIRSSLDDRRGMTAAVDVGLLVHHAADVGDNGPLDLGASISNFGPPLKLGETADPLPLRARGGILWRASPTFDAALDMVFPVEQDPYVSLGGEARFPAAAMGSGGRWVAAVRAGYDQSRARGVDGVAGFSIGGGFDFAPLRVDYAWLPLGDLGSVNRITLAFRF